MAAAAAAHRGARWLGRVVMAVAFGAYAQIEGGRGQQCMKCSWVRVCVGGCGSSWSTCADMAVLVTLALAKQDRVTGEEQCRQSRRDILLVHVRLLD